MRAPAVRFALALALVLFAPGCSEKSSPTQPPPTATALSFTTQPANGVEDTALAGQVRVAVLDQNGAVLSTASTAVTLALGANPGGATLGGSTSASAVGGIATFSGIVLDKVGTGYTLVATATGLTSATSAPFAITLSLADVDHDGYSPNAGDCNDDDPTIHPGAVDFPDSAFVDANCDGLDGDTAVAVFVSPTGSDSAACGTMAAPCLTVDTGVARAAAAGRRDVYVAAGTYTGAVTLADGVGLYGQYGTGWTRGTANTTTLVGTDSADAGGTPEAMTIYAAALTKATVVAGLRLVGPTPAGPRPGGAGRNAYVVLARNVAAGLLTIARSTIVAANGSAGAAGAAGDDAALATATAGMNGGTGGASAQYATLCDNTSRGSGGAAGTNAVAGVTAPNGGAGGAGGTMDTDCQIVQSDLTATAGIAGGGAVTFAAARYGYGGGGGAGATTCGAAGDGADGRVQNGAAGPGAAAGGFLASDDWTALDGGSGGVGENGTGGGGGGGSGGCDNGTNSYGAGGGGGGAGGALARSGGSGGHGGGGSFAIYLVDASPTISDDSIVRGNGGDGGAGGAGGRGQSGGLGGAGGTPSPNGSPGGKGGNGAHGGHGGGGGGGAGGMSAAIYATSAASVPAVSNVVVTGGTGGAGGAGGVSAPSAPAAERDGQDGTAGATGPVLVQGVCVAAGSC
jgi:hypothetical protein